MSQAEVKLLLPDWQGSTGAPEDAGVSTYDARVSSLEQNKRLVDSDYVLLPELGLCQRWLARPTMHYRPVPGIMKARSIPIVMPEQLNQVIDMKESPQRETSGT